MKPKSAFAERTASLLCLHGLHLRAVLCALFLLAITPLAFATQQATTTTVSISSSTVAYQSPVVLTATVTAGGSPVSAGLVLFCDATVAICENNSALGFVQLTSANATASLKIGSGPIGSHSYKAQFRANNLYSSSVSNTVTYTVQGLYPSTTTIAASGTVGSYTLSGTVIGVGSLVSGPTGTLSYLDSSAGNNILTTQALGPAVLSEAYLEAPNSPFAIGTTCSSCSLNRSLAIASAYLNTDNNLDVVTGDRLQTISVLLGNGDGSFQPKVNYPGCPVGYATKIVLDDFNRDGNTDVALGCTDGSSQGGLVILLGNGNGTFGSPVEYASGDVAGLAAGDFNGDGILDFVVTDRTQTDVTVFLGNGNGTFQAGVKVFTGISMPSNVVVADFNGDGKDDIAYAVDTATPNPNANTLSDLYVALGKGDGTFLSATKVASDVGEFLTTGDTNADGIADVVSSSVTFNTLIANSLWVLIGKGDGTFQTPVSYISDIPSDPHITDVNGDGKPDIIAGGSTGALVYLGNGDGTFQAYSEPAIGNFLRTYAVNAGDYNNDGNADLVGTDAGSPSAAVALSQVLQTANAAAVTGIAVFPLGSGTHQVDASYSGDTSYSTSVSGTTPLVAAPTPTTLTMTAPTTPIVVGQSTTLTATLSPYTVGPPTTTTDGDHVTFYYGTTVLGTGTLASGVATISTPALPAGVDALHAVFAGDANYNTSTAATVTATVVNVLLISSVNPSTYGQSVTFTATVAPGATGTVTFNDGTTTLGAATVSGSIATFTTTSLVVATHDMTAVYSGDGTHTGGTSPDVFQIVNKASPVLAVTTSGPSTYGAFVTVTGTLPTGTTGTVTFTSGGSTIGIGSVTSAGTVVMTANTLPVGSDLITASYGGDSNNNPATGSTTEVVAKATPALPAPVANPVTPTAVNAVTLTEAIPSGVSGPVTFYNGSTVLGSASIVGGVATLNLPSLPLGGNSITATTPGDTNNNPAVSPATLVTVIKASPTVTVATSGPSTYGGAVTITATLPTGPTGTVTFSSGGVTLGSGAVNSTTGLASISTTVLPAGSDTITANYGGNATYNSATGSTTQVVAKASPTVTVATSGPSTYGGSVTITATLPAGPTGTVTFTSGGVTLGNGSVTGTGVVSIATTVLPAGNDTITASYSGDSNNNAGAGSTTQTVSKATPSSVLSSSLNPSVAGNAVTLTDTLSVSATGTVTFASGSTALGTATVVNGIASVTTSTLPTGSDSITATYNGDTNNNTTVASLTQTVNKASPGVVVTTSGSSVYGASVTLTATLPAGPTGTVTFTSGGVTLGSGAVSGTGTAVITTTVLAVGTDTITASYGGDTNNNAATGSTTQVVAKLTPTVVVTTSGPSTYGGTVTITAAVPAGSTGTITYTSGGVTLGSGSVNSTTGTSTITTTALPTGTDTITASYGGDSNNNAATGSTTETVGKVSPTLTVTTSGPSSYGSSVTITASLPPGTTGTVTITSGGVTLGSGTVNPTTGIVTITTTSLPAGSNPIVANYGGDTNNNPATGSTSQVVSKDTPTSTLTSSLNPSTFGNTVTLTNTLPTSVTGTVTFTSGTTVLGTSTVTTGVATLTTSALPTGGNPIVATYSGDTNDSSTTASLTQTVNKASPTVTVTTSGPSTYGGSVTVTASVPAGATGTVTFTSGGVTLGSGTVSSTGAVSITTTTLPTGSDTITATYSGDTNDNPGSGSVVQPVAKASPTVTLVSSSNPSTTSQPVTFTATVPTYTTGTVTFTDGSTVLGTGTITNGVATLTVPSLPVGNHSVTATYSGDTNDNGASSTPLTQVVNKNSPVLQAPIVSSTNLNPSQSETISENVPTGIVGPVTFYNGSTFLGTAPIVNGVATLTVPSLPIGTDSITATTPADANNNAAVSPATSVVVAKTTPTVSLLSSANPAGLNQPVTLTASLPVGSTGTVTFLDGTAVLGVGTVNGSGVAVFTTSSLAIGSHSITATYSGDPNYNLATSGPLTQVILKLATAVTLTESAPAELLGTVVTFTATVAAGSPTPTGTVTFFDGGTAVGTTAMSTNGSAVVSLATSGSSVFATSSLTTGSHQITAIYSGDTSFAGSSSLPLTNVVEDFTNTNKGVTSQNIFPGDTTTYTFTLTPVGASNFLSDLNIAISGLPTGATYTIAPASITAGAGATDVVLTLKTSSAMSAENRMPQEKPGQRRGLPIALGMLGLLGLGAIRRNGRKMPRMLMVLLLCAASLLPIAALSGCAGGYFTLTPTNYSITVTGTEGTIQHSATATLVVQ